jgi:hypothetical protein
MTEPKSRQTLNVDLGELRPLVMEAAKNQGTRPGAWVRDAVRQVLQDSGAGVPDALPRVAPNRSRGSAVVRFGGRLTGEGSEALRALAAAEGVSQIEMVERMALAGVGASRARALEVLPGLADRLRTVENELRAVRQQLYEPGALALLEKALREVRTQGRGVARALADVSTTRRRAARKAGADQ